MFPKRYASSAGYVKYQHESAHLFTKGNPWSMAKTISDVIEWAYRGNKLYPTQKPVEALRKLIKAFCPEGGLVLDHLPVPAPHWKLQDPSIVNGWASRLMRDTVPLRSAVSG